MTTEWKDLPTLVSVCNAQTDGWEIEVSPSRYTWVPWGGNHWDSSWAFRGRPRQPKMRKIKIYGYLDTATGETFTVKRGQPISENAVPYPKRDDEVEVPE